MSYSVVIIDDHPLLRDGLKLLLKQEKLRVAGEAGSAKDGLECVKQSQPDLIILDIHLPDVSGLQVLTSFQIAAPAARVLVLTAASDGFTINKAILAGAAGYLLKECSMEELVLAIKAIREGKVYLCPGAAAVVAQNLRQSGAAPSTPVQLSPRESQVLDYLVRGFRNKEIAGEIGVGIKSVDTYRARIMEKTGCRSVSELMQYALKMGRVQF